MTNTLVAEFSDGRKSRIHIKHGLLSDPDTWSNVTQGSKVAIVSNSTVADLYADAVVEHLSVPHSRILIGDGERFKTLDSFQTVINQLIEEGFNRDCTIIALGGGVVGDLAGFVAATYQRGVPLIQIPTTLLAQVDAAVGGKTAVNHPAGKNLIGAFYQPHEVLIDTHTLNTLPDRIYLEGLAEVIKYGVIYDESFFEWLEDNATSVLQREAQSLDFIVRRCCEIKRDVVLADENEQGQRKILNFGHTFGHALEATLGYGQLYHGEAVAVGMVMASHLAAGLSLCDERVSQRILNIVSAYGLPSNAPNETNVDDVIAAMSLDKKVSAGQVNFVLPTKIGQVEVTNEVTINDLQQTIKQFIALN